MTLLHSLGQFKREGAFGHGYPTGLRIFYAPVDDVHGALTAVLAAATTSVAIAMFELADRRLADQMLRLCEDPGIAVQISLDASQAATTWESAVLAAEQYPATAIAIGRSEKGQIMHLKCAVVDGRYTVHGSTNWTVAGQMLEDNALVVIDNAAVAAEAIHRLDAIHAWMLAHPAGPARRTMSADATGA